MEACIKVTYKFEPLKDKKEEHLRFNKLYLHIMMWGRIYYGKKFTFVTKEGLDTRRYATCPHCGERFTTDFSASIVEVIRMRRIQNVSNVIFASEYDKNKTPFALSFTDGCGLKVTWDELRNAEVGHKWTNTRSAFEIDMDLHTDFYATDVEIIFKNESCTVIKYHTYSEFHTDVETTDVYVW